MTNVPAHPSETEIDRLLASRLKTTTPEFEARWREQLRDLRQTPVRRAWWHLSPGAWLGLAVSGAAVAGLLLFSPPASPIHAGEFSPAFQELFAMDPVLERAWPLLDAENRDALLHLPIHPSALP